MSHTPGPWRLDEETASASSGVITSTYHVIEAGSGFCGQENRGFNISGIMSLDNARLIAAAPDMLEALREALNVWDNYRIDSTNTEREVRAKAIAAVAKAMGVQL